MIFPFSQKKEKQARNKPTIGRLSDRNYLKMLLGIFT